MNSFGYRKFAGFLVASASVILAQTSQAADAPAQNSGTNSGSSKPSDDQTPTLQAPPKSLIGTPQTGTGDKPAAASGTTSPTELDQNATGSTKSTTTNPANAGKKSSPM